MTDTERRPFFVILNGGSRSEESLTTSAVSSSSTSFVKLDYQAMFETAEIGDKRANRILTPELRAGQLPRAQSRPKKTLRFRFLVPQPSRAFAWCGWPIHEANFNGSMDFVLLTTSLQDTPRAGLRTRRAPVARG
jgi:hypothetical protein